MLITRLSRSVRRVDRLGLSLALWLVLSVCLLPGAPTQAADNPPFASPDFEITWNRTDKQVAGGQVSRTWVWGPAPFTAGLEEAYEEAPGGKRLVQYLDKSRMEITSPAGDKASPFYVTNGLLARELISGQLQTGNARYETRAPASLGVAGDADDTAGPTYAAFQGLLAVAPDERDNSVQKAVDRTGTLRDSQAEFGQYKVGYAHFEPPTGHNIARPFWDFLNKTDQILNRQGLPTTQRLFDPVFYVTGLPISEAYWARVKVGGTVKDVLVQAFERRMLTFTPANPAAFQVEMGNIGRHYYQWRYQTSLPPPPPPAVTACADVPDGTNGIYSLLKCGPAGMQVIIRGPLPAGEAVVIKPTDPAGAAQPASSFIVGKDGLLDARLNTLTEWAQGLWKFEVQAQTSKKEAVVRVLVEAPKTEPTVLLYPNPGKLDQELTFNFVGFKPNELLTIGLRPPNGRVLTAIGDIRTGPGGGWLETFIPTRDVPRVVLEPGIWGIRATARADSNRTVGISFNLLP